MSDNEKNKCHCNEHGEGCDCEGGEDEILTLIDEDGQERDFIIIEVLGVEDKEYAILLPLEQAEASDNEDEEDDEAIILRFDLDEEGNEFLVDIEDDEEWQRVADAWESTVE